jgi:hypothetical protein
VPIALMNPVTLVRTYVRSSFNESVIELSEKSTILVLVGIAATNRRRPRVCLG